MPGLPLNKPDDVLEACWSAIDDSIDTLHATVNDQSRATGIAPPVRMTQDFERNELKRTFGKQAADRPVRPRPRM